MPDDFATEPDEQMPDVDVAPPVLPEPVPAAGDAQAEAPSIEIDTRFPGGNAVIDSVQDDVIQLHPDLRDSETGWFYWSIRVRGAAGQSLSFVFPDQEYIGPLGPAVSLDEGVTWQWMGNPDGSANSFRCAFPQKSQSVRLSSVINYTDLHWQRFCGRIAHNRASVREEILCFSPRGRAVPRLHVGRLDGKAKHRVLLTARHHACETMGNFALEGLVLAALNDDEKGAWLRQHVELVVLPFMDRDGVEAGDPGKGRRPHDHNRDYGAGTIRPETRALREFVTHWSNQRLAVMIDLHSPWIRGNSHEQIYQVAKLDPTLWAEQRYFGDMLVHNLRGPLPFGNADQSFFGDEWQTASGQIAGVCPADWFAKLPGMRLSTSIEIPYASCSGKRVTAEGVRAFGNDLASAIWHYLDDAGVHIAESTAEDVPLAKIYVDPSDVHPEQHAPPAAAKAKPSPDAKPADTGTPAAGATPARIIIRSTKTKPV